MKINELKTGMIFPNLKELCEFVDIKYKDSTCSRKAIMKELEQYVKIDKQGRKLIIVEIYDTIIKKEDGRKNNGGDKYCSNGAMVLENWMFNYMQNNKHLSRIYVGKSTLCEIVGTYNLNYLTSKEYIGKFISYMFNKVEVINLTALGDVNNFIHNTTKKNFIEAMLNKLLNDGKCKWDEGYVIIDTRIQSEKGNDDERSRMATDEEEEYIKEVEKSICIKFGIKNKSALRFMNKKMKDKFYKEVSKIVTERFNYIKKHYVGFEIIPHYTIEEIKNVNDFKNKINTEIINSLNKYTKNKINNAMNKRKGFNKVSKYDKDRCSIEYEISIEILINTLLKLKYKNIVNDIKQQKTNKEMKIINYLRNKQEAEEYLDENKKVEIENDDSEGVKQALKYLASI